MGLAKKGTRLITVERERYRWVVAPNDEPGMAIVVEAADVPGQRMVTWVEHGTTISPWLVREAILHALSQGWQPQVRAPERVFRLETPSIRGALRARLKAQLSGLCDVFQGRVPGIEDVRELAHDGELAVAFHALCDHWGEVHGQQELSLSEFEQLAELGEGLECRAEWVDLVTCLRPEDRVLIPPRLRALATKHIASELSRTPARRDWLQQLREMLQHSGAMGGEEGA